MKDEKKGSILWVDDEIELLRSHVLFLREKGFDVETATNGDDAIELVGKKAYDLIFLDEMMSGKNGLETLAEIKEISPATPVVMITKNEEESLMEEAIGSKISDYLTKPVNPSQVFLTCKKFLESKKIQGEQVSRESIQEFGEISRRLLEPLDHDDWVTLYSKIVAQEMELDQHPDLDLRRMLSDQRRECNAEFGKFVERNYRQWIDGKQKGPALSVNVVDKYLIPKLQKGKPVFFFVIDCLRLDQWLIMEQYLREWFSIEKEYYYSILPTATPYARNAIFSGLYPLEIEQRYPEFWAEGGDDESSCNKFEKQLLDKLLERRRVQVKPEPKYVKILDSEFGRQIENNILSYASNKLTSIVVNFVDMIAHGRSDSSIMKEIAPDESGYRSLTDSWFRHSSLLGMLKTLATKRDVRIVLTTDHGSIRCMRGAKVIGDKEASTNLRYKFGRNLKSDEKEAIFLKDPHDFKLPRSGVTTNYIIAKEDYYFVYPTDYHKYLSQYRDSFQHGGISMEEVILPVIMMEPK
ncbi:MAG: bifunctional response regulator/alkaline phosphatase family protein [Ignavibacteriales bacterium]|nr:bifunctional response regulator/alkaline phosphatase family protein [Ignavibacteriales bacterium]